MMGMRVKRVAALWLAVLTTCLWAPGPAVLAMSLVEPTDTESQPLSAPMVYDDQEKAEGDAPPPDDGKPEAPGEPLPGDSDGQPDGAGDVGEQPGEGEDEKESPEQPDSEGSVSDADGPVGDGLVYDPQPEGPLDAEELERLLEEEKLPRWELAVDEEWIPEGWRQVRLTDEETGAVYWTVEPTAGIMAAMTPFSIDPAHVATNWAQLVSLIGNATIPTVYVDGDFPATSPVVINRDVKIASAQPGTSMTLTQTVDQVFRIQGGTVEFEDIILDGGGQYGMGIYVNATGNVTIAGAVLENTTANFGGAIYVYAAAALKLQDITIRDTSAIQGGGIFVLDADDCTVQDVEIYNSSVEGNSSWSALGGAIHIDVVANTCFIKNVKIQNSSASYNGNYHSYGGAISVWRANTCIIQDAEISQSSVGGAPNENYGGAIYIGTITTSCVIEKSSIDDSYSDKLGGAVFILNAASCTIREMNINYSRTNGASSSEDGGAIYVVDAGTLTIEDSAFTNTSAYRGGAIATNRISTSCIIQGTTFANTSATYMGGAIFISTLTSCTSIIQGVEISGSRSMGTNGVAGYGGAICTGANVLDITIRDSSITDSTAQVGGGVYFSPTTAANTYRYHLDNVTIQNCASVSPNVRGGGAIAAYNPAYLVPATVTIIENSLIDNNSAVLEGGGIQAYGELAIRDTQITNNTSQVSGGGIYCYGELVIEGHSTIEGNSSALGGGGVYLSQAGSLPSSLQLADSVVQDNHADSGGGLYVSSGDVSLEDAGFADNTASTDGGAVWLQSPATLAVTRSSFTGNIAGSNGGGIYTNGTIRLTDARLEKNQADSGGGLAVVSPGSVSAQNSRFAENQADTSGGAIYTYSLDDVTLQNVELVNNVVPVGYAIALSPGLSSTHNSKIIDTQYTYPFQNAYNNGDISNGSGSGSIAAEPDAQSKKHFGIYIAFYEDDLAGTPLERLEYKTYASASPEYLLDNDPDLPPDWLSHYRPSADHSVTRYYVYVDATSGWVETDRLPAVVEADDDTFLAVLYAVNNSGGSTGGSGSGGGSTSTPPPTTTAPEESGGEESGGEEEGGEEDAGEDETPDEEAPPEEQEEQQAAVGGSQSGGGSGGRGGGSGFDRSDDGSPDDNGEEDAHPDADGAAAANGANGAAKGTGAIVVDPTSAIPLLEQELPLVAFVNAIGVDSGTTIVIEASQNTSGGQLWIRLGSIAMFGTPACWILGFFIKRHKNKKRDVLPED